MCVCLMDSFAQHGVRCASTDFVPPPPLGHPSTSLKEELGRIEKQVYDLEEGYLLETLATGNVLKGWAVALQEGGAGQGHGEAAGGKKEKGPASKKVNREVRKGL